MQIATGYVTFHLEDAAYKDGLGRSLRPESREAIDHARKTPISRDVTCTPQVARDMLDYYYWQTDGFATIEDARASTCFRAYKNILDVLRWAQPPCVLV